MLRSKLTFSDNEIHSITARSLSRKFRLTQTDDFIIRNLRLDVGSVSSRPGPRSVTGTSSTRWTERRGRRRRRWWRRCLWCWWTRTRRRPRMMNITANQPCPLTSSLVMFRYVTLFVSIQINTMRFSIWQSQSHSHPAPATYWANSYGFSWSFFRL